MPLGELEEEGWHKILLIGVERLMNVYVSMGVTQPLPPLSVTYDAGRRVADGGLERRRREPVGPPLVPPPLPLPLHGGRDVALGISVVHRSSGRSGGAAAGPVLRGGAARRPGGIDLLGSPKPKHVL